jgi:hypothetical protein
MYEADRRFEYLKNDDFSERHVIWLCKNLLDFISLELFSSWFNEYAAEKNHRYVDPLARYYSAENLKNRVKYKSKTDLISTILLKINCDAVLIASADDTINFELIRSLNEKEIKVVLVEREGTHSNISSKKLAQLYLETSPLTADLFFCANENHLNCYLDASLENSKGYIAGELRADIWFNRDFNYSNEFFNKLKSFDKLVTYLAFGEKNYIEPCFHPNVNGTWSNLSSSITEVLSDAIKNNPKVMFVYKMGHVEDFNKSEINKLATYELCYGNQFHVKKTTNNFGFNIKSSGFTVDRVDGEIFLSDIPIDDTFGKIFFFKFDGTSITIVTLDAGVVDYKKGEIIISPVIITGTTKAVGIEIQAVPESNDVIGLRDLYLELSLPNTVVNMLEDTITTGEDTSASSYVTTSSYVNGNLTR